MNKMKKLISALAIVSVVFLTAGTVQAADFDNGTGDGLWSTAANWDNGSVPDNSDVRIGNGSTGWRTCTISNFVATASRVRIGEDAGGTLNLVDGGTLTTASDDVRVGYDKAAGILNLVSGEMNVGKDLEIGQDNAGTLTMTSGTITVRDDLEIGKSYAGIFTMNGGTVVLNDTFENNSVIRVYASGSLNIHGGTVSAPQLNMSGSALIDLWHDGELFIEDISTNQLAAFVDDGNILGNRLTNKLNIVWGIVDPGTTNAVTNATITAIDCVPNLAGLSTNEAADVLAEFGYIVGTITEGTAPDGITGLVAAQVPVAGTAPLTPGSAINLVIQEAGEVPDVVGLAYAVATNLIVQSGYVVGAVVETYVFEATPGLVTEQIPAAGTEIDPGEPVHIYINEQQALPTIIVGQSSGDWMDSVIWDLGVIPERETQNYEVQINAGFINTLSDFVANRRLHIGQNGTGIAQLDIMNGGHYVGFNDYVCVGWSQDAVLNVYTGGILEARKALRIGWNGSSATINIDGGTVSVANDWMSLGNSDRTNAVTGLPFESEINIKNGGSLLIHHFRDRDEANDIDYDLGVVNLAEGTLATIGTDTTAIEDRLASGIIVMAPGYSALKSVIDGNYTLTGVMAGYSSWATNYGVGAGTNDYDGDLANNLSEYAFNGNPTNGAITGVSPKLVNNNGVMEYTYPMRAGDDTLTYTVETSTNLLVDAWTDIGSFVLGTNVIAGDYSEVTNLISTVDDQSFIRTKVVQ